MDDRLIERAHGVHRTLHQPVKDEGGRRPVLALDGEFDVPATLEANGSIVYDPRLRRYVMYAIGFAAATGDADRARLFRFTSSDGIDWIRGDDGRSQRIAFEIPQNGRRPAFLDIFSCALTSPQRFPPGRLTINAAGPVRLELLSERGSTLARRTVRGDSTQHLPGCPPPLLARARRLRFDVGRGGALYSFAVR